MANPIVSLLCAFPWERFVSNRRAYINKPSSPPAQEKHGCLLAEDILVAKGMLEGLGQGLGHYGVLHQVDEHLEAAEKHAKALADEPMRDRLLELRLVCAKVKDPTAARGASQELERLLPAVWEHGAACPVEQP